MTQFYPRSGGPGVLLFDEDFDLPAASMEPEVILPVYSAAEMMAAREIAAEESRDTALAEAGASSQAAVARALTEIAAQIGAARDEAASIAEQSAEAIARLLLDCFAAAFPALSMRHGPGEVAAVLGEILPALHREPKITVRISPHLFPAMSRQLETLDADLAARVRLLATDAVPAGDARISWDNGAATRDAVSLWNQIESILAPAGLLNAKQTVKERELVE